MKNQEINNVYFTLGAVWIIVGLIIYPNPAVWPLGFIFLIIGLIRKFGSNK